MAEKMTSSEFRLRYASLDQPVVVTVLGRPIGLWTPVGEPAFPTTTAAAPVQATVSPLKPADWPKVERTATAYKAVARKPKA